VDRPLQYVSSHAIWFRCLCQTITHLTGEQQTAASSAFGSDKLRTAESSVANLTEYERKLTEFNQKRPQLRYSTRIVSWSDPVSMRGMARTPSSEGKLESPDSDRDWGYVPNVPRSELGEPSRKQALVNLRLHRSDHIFIDES
jgi:hypothetical protein